ncbi:hypothetical protein [Cohnella faecalis]|uniref:DUF5050 domain-containing protein n=1 Tax=Cohnella faecalis TaxID=2315694 RepID=A0A398CXU0_9BACL|nr:hypothetical protein [Cohnella faecalis]RIE05348.1 hypothetical protein D3H35_00725 [Cohnella faecalis]
MYDVSSKKEQQLTTSGKAYTPDINGNLVVWAENRGKSLDIYTYNLSTSQETQITNTDSLNETSPVIAGENIVYSISKGIYLYEIDKSASKKINTLADNDSSAQISFSASGDRVAWYENTLNSGTGKRETAVYTYTISEDKTDTIATGKNQQKPSIYEDKLVWEDRQSDEQSYSTIYFYDLSQQEGKFLDFSGKSQSSPVIYEDNVAWIDGRSGTNQIYVYNLTASSGETITTSNGAKASVDIYEDTLVWSVSSNIYSNKDIGPSAADAVNQAVDVKALKNLLENQEIGLTLGSYSGWKNGDKDAVVANVFAARPDQGYASVADVQTAFDNALTSRTPLANVNLATNVATLAEALEDTKLQLDLTALAALNETDRDAALHAMLTDRPSNGYASKENLQIAVIAAVLSWTTSSWKYVGEQAMKGWFGDLAVNRQGKLYVAYQDNENQDKATVKTFDGTSWQTVGSAGLSAGAIQTAMALSFDSNDRPYVAYSDSTKGNKVTVKRFDGTAWQLVGSEGFSEDYPFYLSMVIDKDNVPYVGYRASNRGYVKKFNGTSWVNAGTGALASGDISYLSMDLDSSGTPYVAFEGSDGKAVVKKLSGSSWNDVGNPGNTGPAYYMQFALGANDTPYVAYVDTQDEMKLVVLQYSGGSWVRVNIQNPPKLQTPHFDFAIYKGTLYITLYDVTHEKRATLMKLVSGVWTSVDSPGFTDGSVDIEISKFVFFNDVVYIGFLNRYSPISNTTTVISNNNLNGDPTYSIGALGDNTLLPLDAGYASGKQETRSIAIQKTGSGI